MQSGRPRMPSGFPGSFPPQQGASSLFGASGYAGGSLPSQPSTESASGEPSKQGGEGNLARRCRVGQELVHEIVQKATEVFHVLKTTQLPNHLPTNSLTYNDRKKLLQETMKTIVEYFRQLKQVYATVKDSAEKLNVKPVEDLIPFIDETDSGEPTTSDGTISADDSLQSDAYKQVAAEHLALTQQLQAKNVHLKKIIDNLRNLLWEINTMMNLKNATSH